MITDGTFFLPSVVLDDLSELVDADLFHQPLSRLFALGFCAVGSRSPTLFSSEPLGVLNSQPCFRSGDSVDYK